MGVVRGPGDMERDRPPPASSANAEIRETQGSKAPLRMTGSVTRSTGSRYDAFSASCSSRHITFPEPDFGSASTNSTTRGTL